MRVLSLSLSLTALSIVGHAFAYPHAVERTGAIQRRQDAEASERAEAVKEAFQHAWRGYRQYAFPHDELHPVSNGYGDSR